MAQPSKAAGLRWRRPHPQTLARFRWPDLLSSVAGADCGGGPFTRGIPPVVRIRTWCGRCLRGGETWCVPTIRFPAIQGRLDRSTVSSDCGVLTYIRVYDISPVGFKQRLTTVTITFLYAS